MSVLDISVEDIRFDYEVANVYVDLLVENNSPSSTSYTIESSLDPEDTNIQEQNRTIDDSVGSYLTKEHTNTFNIAGWEEGDRVAFRANIYVGDEHSGFDSVWIDIEGPEDVTIQVEDVQQDGGFLDVTYTIDNPGAFDVSASGEVNILIGELDHSEYTDISHDISSSDSATATVSFTLPDFEIDDASVDVTAIVDSPNFNQDQVLDVGLEPTIETGSISISVVDVIQDGSVLDISYRISNTWESSQSMDGEINILINDIEHSEYKGISHTVDGDDDITAVIPFSLPDFQTQDATVDVTAIVDSPEFNQDQVLDIGLDPTTDSDDEFNEEDVHIIDCWVDPDKIKAPQFVDIGVSVENNNPMEIFADVEFLIGEESWRSVGGLVGPGEVEDLSRNVLFDIEELGQYDVEYETEFTVG